MAGKTPHGARPNRERARASERTARPKPPGRLLEPASNAGPRGMVVTAECRRRASARRAKANRIRLTAGCGGTFDPTAASGFVTPAPSFEAESAAIDGPNATYGYVPGHRRGRLHRLAPGRRTVAARRDASAWPTTSHRQARESAAAAERRARRGRPGRSRRRAARGRRAATSSCTRPRFRRCRDRSRIPSRRIAPTSTRTLQRAGGRARRRRQAAGVRRVVVGLRRHRGAAEARGHAAQPAVALRAAEARRRAVPAAVHDALRPRDRDHPLLQRVRPAPGSRRRPTPA